MTENLPNLVKKKKKESQDQEVQGVPNKLDQKRPTARYIVIKMARLKGKERILKATKKSSELPTRELPLDCQLISQQEHFRPEGSGMKY